MSYKIHIDLYVGLTHGKGEPHYSIRELRRVLGKSKLKTSPVTCIPAIGVEGGIDEDTIILRMIWPPLSLEDIPGRCAALNDILRSIFAELHQRWVLLAFETMENGIPLKKNDISLTPDRPAVTVADLLPASAFPAAMLPQPSLKPRRSVTQFVTALISIPFSFPHRPFFLGSRPGQKSYESALRTTAAELADQFGGSVLSFPNKQNYWRKQGIIQRQDFALIEVDVPDRPSKVRWLKNYVKSTLLRRFQERAIALQFVRWPEMGS